MHINEFMKGFDDLTDFKHDFEHTKVTENQTKTYDDYSTYKGTTKGEHRHGAGEHIEADGSVYTGEWKDD